MYFSEKRILNSEKETGGFHKGMRGGESGGGNSVREPEGFALHVDLWEVGRERTWMERMVRNVVVRKRSSIEREKCREGFDGELAFYIRFELLL